MGVGKTWELVCVGRLTKRKMGIKFLIIHNIAWSHYKAVVFSELYKICEKRGVELNVIHIAMNEKGRKALGIEDLSLHNYPFKILFNKPLEETSTFERTCMLIKEIRKFKPAIIALSGWNNLSYWALTFYCKSKGIKVILANDSTKFDKKRTFPKEFIKSLLVKSSDAYWCYGTKSEEYLLALGAKCDRIFRRYQATDSHTIYSVYEKISKDRRSLSEKYKLRPKNFVYAGRLSSEKNLMLLLKAFRNIKQNANAKKWGLIIVGDGPQRPEIEKFISSANIKDIWLVGGKSWKEVPEYYALSDVFILPSVSEPWGLVVNEAMICGLPVIVSKRAGAYWDLVKDGINGFGFDPYNQKELEEIMLKFIEEKIDVSVMGRASRDIIREYTPENAAKQMFKAIEYILREA